MIALDRQNSLEPKDISRNLFLHILGVFIVCTIIVLLFWAVLPNRYRQNESTDYLYYYEPVARNLLSGSGLNQRQGLPATSNPPGYPFFLAAIFTLAGLLRLPENLVHSAFILLCMSFSSIFVFLLSHKNWGIRGAWFSSLFFSTCPFVLWLTKQPESEVPFMLAFFAGLYLFWLGLSETRFSGWLLFFSGLIIGLAMLFRGIALGAGGLLFILALILKKNIPVGPRALLASAILIGNLVAVLPWQIWLYRQTDQLVLLGTNAVPSIRDGLTFAANAKGYRQFLGIPEDVYALQKEFLEESSSANSVSQIYQIVQADFFRQPFTVMKLIFIKMLRSWYGTDSGSMETGIIVVQLFYASVVILSSILLYKRGAEYPGLLLVIWSFVLYFWIMTTMVLSILRYMTPVIGLWALLVPALRYLPRSSLQRLRIYP